MKHVLTFISIVMMIAFLAGCKIGGVITEEDDSIQDVTIVMEGDDQRTTFTNKKGIYYFENILPGSYTITPFLEGYRFEPEKSIITHEAFAKGMVRFDFQAIPDAGPVCHDVPWEGDFLIDDEDDLETLAGYSTITGNLTITNVSSLDGLQCLTLIEGSLVIQNTALVTLDGLNNLETINSSLFINSNPELEDILGGLENLTKVGGFVIINSNPNLPASQTNDLTSQLVDYVGGWF